MKQTNRKDVERQLIVLWQNTSVNLIVIVKRYKNKEMLAALPCRIAYTCPPVVVGEPNDASTPYSAHIKHINSSCQHGFKLSF